jgi:transcriptional regulator
MGRATAKQELLPGTLDMLILKSLTRGVMHGYGIVEHIRTRSAEVLSVEEGSLYPALQRLQLQGLVASEWGHSVNNRRARYYRLTAAGRKQLGQVESSFERLIGAIRRVMTPARGPAGAPDPKTADGSAAMRALRRAAAPRRG